MSIGKDLEIPILQQKNLMSEFFVSGTVVRRLETLVPKSFCVRSVLFSQSRSHIITSLPVVSMYVCVFTLCVPKNCHLDMIYLKL